MEKYDTYFKEICPEDENDIIDVCEAASKKIKEKLKIAIDDPVIIACIFSKTFENILKKLASFESSYYEYEINICNRLVIGYKTKENEDDEKEGNFMIYINHLNSSKTQDEPVDANMTIKELTVQWAVDNIIDNPDILRDIAAKTVEQLKAIDIVLGFTDPIWPIFIFVYERLVDLVKVKRRDTNEFEYEIDFLSCFSITARESDEEDDIDIRPSIQCKLAIKNDAIATAKHED